MLTPYPHFSKLKLSDQEVISKFTAHFEPFSDFNFTSLFCWNTDDSTEVTILNHNFVIRMPGYLDGHPIYSVLGGHLVDKTVNELLNQYGKLELVPEKVVQSLKDKSMYLIEEDRDNFDYIYDLAHLRDLSGNKFKKKRNKNNVFVREHANYELEVKITRKLDLAHVERLVGFHTIAPLPGRYHEAGYTLVATGVTNPIHRRLYLPIPS